MADQPKTNKTQSTKPVPALSPSSLGSQRTIIHDASNLASASRGQMPEEKAQIILTAKDRRGLNGVMWSAIQAGANSESLLALLTLLEPTEKEANTSQMILDLLMAQAEAITRIEKKQITLESKIDGLRARFPTH